MKYIKTTLIILINVIVLSCTTFNSNNIEYIQSGDYKLAVRKSGSDNITVVFESALGEYMETWIESGIENKVNNFASVILYNRAGLYPSEDTAAKLTIENAINDLDKIISTIPKNNKIVLVGHSLGGAIIRAYTMQNPNKISGLIFVDTSHEVSLELYKPEKGKTFVEDSVEYLLSNGWVESDTAVREYKEFENTLLFLKDFDPLPNIFVTTITAMNGHSSEQELEAWRNAHLSLGNNNLKHNHIDAMNSSHYIQESEPEIIVNAIKEITSNIKNEQ